MHTSKLFCLWHRHVPGSLSQCIWLACPTSMLCYASSLDQTMEETNSSRTKRFSLKQTIMHIAAAVQAALEGKNCVAQHELESNGIGVVNVVIVVNIIVTITFDL